MIEVKCPHCFEWNIITQYQYHIEYIIDCVNCFHAFALSKATAQNVI